MKIVSLNGLKTIILEVMIKKKKHRNQENDNAQ